MSDYEVFIDREKLRSILQNANIKGPLFLISRLVAEIFNEEDLANSCGQGLHKTGKDDQGRPPLDATKLRACKGKSDDYAMLA